MGQARSVVRSAREPGTRCDAEGSASLQRVAVELCAASFAGLFQELTLIRWLPSQVRVLAYFPNLILLSAFLGLGLGCLRAGRRSLLWLWPAGLLVLCAAALGMSRIAFTQNSITEHLWLLYHDLPRDAPVVGDVRPPIILTFVLSALTFVPLGQIVAERLRQFQARSSALWGYCWDILGSLMGVVAFAAICFLQTAPLMWFALFLAVGLLFFGGGRRRGYLAAAAAVLLVVAGAERAERYSPYYAISVDSQPQLGSTAILTNGSLHQYILRVARGDAVPDAWTARARDGYHVPYRLLDGPPQRVLVLGAGTGNDVAVALDEGAEQVDAVEIDPAILKLGGQLHPDHPYASPRVHTINTDARSFLNDSTDKYDLIVFGTLDSMTRLSALSNVRLDNYVYTSDCLQAARAHLSPTGGIVMYFSVMTDFIDQRLAGMLAQTFSEPPIVFGGYYNLFNRIYLAGPAFAGRYAAERAAVAGAARAVLSTIEMPTDDWPYLYLRTRAVSGFYLSLMGTLALLAVVSVAFVSREMRHGLKARREIDGEMFCFGLAFLLLETKSVTAMNLVWGATWLTSAIVFGSILVMVLLGTVAMQIRPWSWNTALAGLVGALLLTYSTPVHLLLRLSVVMKLMLSLLFVGAPIFFAAACFAMVFKMRDQVERALGWNLLGAVAGGLLEFFSMTIGISALSLVALAAYLVAVLIRLRSRTAPDWQGQAPVFAEGVSSGPSS